MKSVLIIISVIVGLTTAQEVFNRPCRSLDEYDIKKDFQPELYLKEWFEIERYDQVFQRNLDCVRAFYTLNADGSIRVLNKGHNLQTAEWRDDIGRAVISFPDEVPLPAMLNVTFDAESSPDNSNYWVLSTDYTNYAVVTSCSNLPAGRSAEFFWLLSRTAQMTPADRRNADAIILRLLDPSRIRPTIQDARCPPLPNHHIH